MNRSFVLMVIVVAAAVLAAPAWNFQDKKPISAIIIKIVKDVERKGGLTSGWSNAVNDRQLKAGYEVRTKEKSFAMIKFDDGSKVNVREKSILTLQGEVSGNRILSREIRIDRGRTVFEIKKQTTTEQFRFTSPISVASIRGTEGGAGYDPDMSIADLTLITGIADFSSTGTGKSVNIRGGQTGIIDSMGVRVEPASPGALENNNPNSPINQGNFGDGTGGPGQIKTSTSFALNTSLTGTLTTGQGVALRITMANPPVNITQALMRYRNQGDPTYKTLSLTISGLNLSGIIPGTDIKAGTNKTFEYYFSMTGSNGKTYTFPENTPDVVPYTLPIKPKVVSIRIPITTPTGESRFLQISYEE